MPVLSINSPAAGTYFHVFDTVFVNVNVSDELNIEWLKLDIISAQNTIVVASQVRTDFSSLSESVNQPLIIDNIHIESGTFHVRATVSDGTNENYAFREIHIFEAPLERMKVYAVSNPTTSTTRIDSLSSNEFVSATEWGQQANIAAVNSWDGELMVIGENSGDILMLSGEELIPTETIAGLGNGSNPDYNNTEFHPDFHQYFSSRFVGEVEIRRAGGSAHSGFNTTSGFRPFSLEPVNSEIIIEERNLAGTDTYVSAYNRNSGALLTSLALNGELIEITHDGDQIWLWGNSDSQGKLWLFDSVTGFITEVYAFGTSLGLIRDAVAQPDGRVGVAFLANSMVVDPGMQPSFGTLWDYGGDEIDYDEDGNDFLVRNGETLYILAPGDNNPHAQITVPQNTFEILILYNK